MRPSLLLPAVAWVCVGLACGPNSSSTQGTSGDGWGGGGSSGGGRSTSGGSSGSGSGGSSGSGSGGSSGSSGGSSGTSGGSSSGSSSGGSGSGGGNYGPIGTTNPTSGFFHPGVVVTQGALNYVKDQVAAGMEPWKSAFDKLKTYVDPTACGTQACGALPYTPKPPSDTAGVVTCGSHSMPDIHCTDEKRDSLAAYTDALIWYISGDEAYAKQAISILNAWSITTNHVDSNAVLQAGWVGTVWPRAAELIRYTYPQSKYPQGWADADALKFASMLKTAFYKAVNPVAKENGNWELSLADAAMQMAVFNDDKTEFNTAVKKWKDRVSVYFYLMSDGTPQMPSVGISSGSTDTAGDGWFGLGSATGLPDGVSQETCRDLEHVQYGIGAAINAAETAKIQGTDLYNDAATQGGARLLAAMEFHAGLLKGRTNATPDLSNVAAPMSVTCNSATGSSTGSVAVIDHSSTVHAAFPVQPLWDMGYNEFVNRESKLMPNTLALITANRPLLATHHLDWETITKAGVGKDGMP